MRDEHDRGLRLQQRGREVVDERDGEVVGRLVEQQQRRLAEHQPREVDAPPLTDRERADRPLQVALAQQAGLADEHVQLVVVEVGQLGIGGAQRVERRQRLVELVLLREQADARAAAHGQRAAVGLEPAGEQLQQRRLAGAVGSAHDQPPARRQLDLLRRRPIAEAPGDRQPRRGQQRLDRLVVALVGDVMEREPERLRRRRRALLSSSWSSRRWSAPTVLPARLARPCIEAPFPGFHVPGAAARATSICPSSSSSASRLAA